MIRPSPELVAIARRWLHAIQRRDGATLRNLVSDSDYLSIIGTSENEMWTGRRVRDGLTAHFLELPAITTKEHRVEAYEMGETGWAYYEYTMQIEGRTAPVVGRTTLVFALQDGNWRIIHRHASFPRPNIDVIGAEQRALDDLMKAARDDDVLRGETGIASVMFTDIAGSSALAASLGDRRWAAIIHDHLALVRASVEGQGGRLVKSLGDGTMSAFGSAGAAMQAAIDLQRRLDTQPEEPRLQVRIGIHTGDVVDAGDDFFGTVVNKAARIAALVAPGEIRVSDATRIMVGGASAFRFSDPARVALRGLEGEHDIFRLEWQE